MRRMYSYNQLEEIVKKVIADTSNYGDLVETFDGQLRLPASLTVISSYCKVVRNFNELQFIFNARVQNATEESIYIANDTQVCNFGSLPTELKEKIYAHNGNNLNHSDTEGSIAMTALYVSLPTSLGTGNPRYVNMYHSGGNIAFYHLGENLSNLEIEAGQVIDLEARISLAL